MLFGPAASLDQLARDYCEFPFRSNMPQKPGSSNDKPPPERVGSALRGKVHLGVAVAPSGSLFGRPAFPGLKCQDAFNG